MMNKKLILLIISGLLIGYIAGSPYVFKAGNPLSVVSGMIALSFSEEKAVQISSNPDRYITKSKHGIGALFEMMREEGWTFQEIVQSYNKGSGLRDNRYEYAAMFRKDGYSMWIQDIRLSRNYRVLELYTDLPDAKNKSLK